MFAHTQFQLAVAADQIRQGFVLAVAIAAISVDSTTIITLLSNIDKVIATEGNLGTLGRKARLIEGALPADRNYAVHAAIVASRIAVVTLLSGGVVDSISAVVVPDAEGRPLGVGRKADPA